MSETAAKVPAAILRVGTQALAVEADRIYVIGSGERADLRIRHQSVASYHATFSAHDGTLRIEDLGDSSGIFIGDVRISGVAEVPPGTRVRLGAIEVGIEKFAPHPLSASGTTRPTGFAEMMAEELRHAPWLAASLLVHALVFLLFFLLLADDRYGQPGRRLASITVPADAEAEEFGPAMPEAEAFEVEMDAHEVDLQDLELRAIQDEIADEEPDFGEPTSFAPDAFGGTSMFQRIGGGKGGPDVLQSIGGGEKAGGFRRTVEGLRESGLEIVFVFDSTGSMGPVLDATKKRLTRMLEALVALVPDVRVGVVTYRDRGQREGYLTRSVPLARDLYRAINFMQTVEAAGGGDRPEAVYDGLNEAIHQRWRPGARRVIVLVGDAPAHDESERKLDQTLRRFTRGGRSFVHAIPTSLDAMRMIDPKTRKSFERIAKVGNGVCLPFEHEESILRQVLTLAIGKDFREQVDRVYELLEERTIPVSRTVREAVDSADRDRILRLLSRPTVPPELMQALTESRSLGVAEVLIEALTNVRLPEPGRQAAAFALQVMLDLHEPPADVERGARIQPPEANRLQDLARQMLR